MEMEFAVVFRKSSKIGNLTQLTKSLLNLLLSLLPSLGLVAPKNCRHFSPDTSSHQGNTINETSLYVRKKQALYSYVCHCYLSFLFHAAEPNPWEICTNTTVPVTRNYTAYLSVYKRTGSKLSPYGFY